MHVKKGQMVVVLAGKYKGKKGRVISVNIKKDKVTVEGVAVVSRHVKAQRAGEKSEIKRKESPIHVSNVRAA